MEPEYRYVSSDLYPIVFEVPEQNGEEGMWKMVLECLEWKIEHWIFRLFWSNFLYSIHLE